MVLTVLHNPWLQMEDSDSVHIAGCILESYEAGTSTPKALYADHNGETALSNPYQFGSEGWGVIYGAGSYKFVIKYPKDNHTEADMVLPYDGVEVRPPIVHHYMFNINSFIARFLECKSAAEALELIQVADNHEHEGDDVSPAESPDGSRTNFSTLAKYRANSLKVTLNGQTLTPGLTYNEDTDRLGYTFVTAPKSNASIRHRYIKA